MTKKTNDNIKQALDSFCEDDGYWMKLYFLSGSSDGDFSKKGLDEMARKLTKKTEVALSKRVSAGEMVNYRRMLFTDACAEVVDFSAALCLRLY